MSDTELMTPPLGTDERPIADPVAVDVGTVPDGGGPEGRSTATGPPPTGTPAASADHGDGAAYNSCAAAVTAASHDRCSTAWARIHDGDVPTAGRSGLPSGVTGDAIVWWGPPAQPG
eukprot:TRINITY_DN2398_c0_g1_i1.p4 TRINITY_DN2398_c0_g1~~TRINITY_DN2398_c0_g1_i1.p4  ORF type:complete len:117 (+),score=29.53 TRINITY_DN2398_c0_g1_i1:412-762(+)